MKVFVTGAAGQLGHDVMKELAARGHQAVGSDLDVDSINDRLDGASYLSLDITDEQRVMDLIKEVRPDALIHCAAWTAVDAAEDEENRDKVRRINVDGTANIAAACKAVDAAMLYLSTDYVFDGQGSRPWQADCKDFAPLNVYGQSKLEGEKRVTAVLSRYFIVRIAWVFGNNGSNFVKTMLRVGKGRDFVTVVDDQIGTPTYTPDLSRLLVDMIETDRYGFYHATNSEDSYISWADFTEEIYRQAGYSTQVKRVSSEEYGLSKARRPRNSRLDKSKLAENGFIALPGWKDALARFLQEYYRDK